ncbi:MAG: hypothetical protein OH338_01705 [Candidatus Parvarchaeota archaeon]|nr:hypothetical protein [Candidatus Parvarchaeota archaeon]MCW1294552.1 hypothetical protein [Candidatus Parvarchaeum tengchongense]MCW1295623.1 hypothetical protein [Candidatus Parvarchaeum tengchongense]MCW1299290.1 hypothetical protein [Candidatus Parvarchaeum tengchongense]MCW1312129.1 hypothetical protein [Candidatus Parvarchaeum tengchongense]
MMPKNEKGILDDLLKQNYITVSDEEILNLISKNEDLTVLQSMDTFNWYKNKGESKHIIAKKGSKNLMYLDKNLDLFLVNMEKLKETNNSYVVSSELYTENFSEKNSIPNLASLNVSVYDGLSKKSLDNYSLIKSERYFEYPNVKEERENLNKTIKARFYSEEEGNGITLVYRQTINKNKVIGSRIYLLDKGGLKNLDKIENERLISFMMAVDYWHDNELSEGNAKLEKFGTGLNVPSYMSMYY